MPGSQLRRLKASLKTAGVIGQPQQSKKSKKQQKSNGATNSDTRLSREAALQSIREEFNPFEIKKNREKHAVSGGRKIKGAQGRPGLSKQVGEEIRRNTLLVEMQRRGKVGGIVDRRFGENDPSMAPEDKMLERYTRERQRRSKNGDIFNLEDDVLLTHYGQSLGATDDFDNDIPFNSDEEGDNGMGMLRSKKRALPLEDGGQLSDKDEEDDGKPPRKKSKAEVMKEVIAKSKLHKYERQQAKDEDEDLREELDAELKDIKALLAGIPFRKPELIKVEMNGQLNPDRLANIQASTNVDSSYDKAVREMTYDRRSKPADRTKSAEEQAEEKAKQLEKLEKNRLRRMRGEDSEEEAELEELDENDEFGIGAGMKIAPEEHEFVHGTSEEEESESESEMESESEDDEGGEDEDSFPAEVEVIVNGLKASKEARTSDAAEFSDDYRSDASEIGNDADSSEADELDKEPAKPVSAKINGTNLNGTTPKINGASKAVPTKEERPVLAYTFPCPQTHEEFKTILKVVNIQDIPTVVQRIRVLHHSSLHPDNKAKLAGFTTVLLTHVMWLADNANPVPFDVMETLIRHVHSLTKVHPQSSAAAFRDHYQEMHSKIAGGKSVSKGDMMLLVGTATIFPTSDHFHLIVTPASLVMGRYLENFPPKDLESLSKGTFVVTLCAQFQSLSKRVIPEAVNFILQGLTVLSPVALENAPGGFPIDHSREAGDSLRLKREAKSSKPSEPSSTKLNFNEIFSSLQRTDSQIQQLKSNVAIALSKLLTTFATLYAGKTAFIELFSPASILLAHLTAHPKQLPASVSTSLTSTLKSLTPLLTHAAATRRPLELHHHRPLPIPSNIPKFEEGYSLDRHYDPDRERKELAKLKVEHKRERKGALRELRKDASFVAREKLKERKEADGEYHKKMKRIVGMINSEEGAATREYEREKEGRKKKGGK